MSGFSLKRQLLAGTIIAIVTATVLAGIGINAFSASAFRALALSEIEDQMRLLLAAIEVGSGGELTIEEGPQDPRFELPNSGYYWQAGRNGAVELRSQSLWDEGLPWSGADSRASLGPLEVTGPNGAQLIAVERPVTISTAGGDQTVHAMIAMDTSAMASARWRFVYAVAPSLIVLMLALLGAILLFLRYGLRPLDRLRASLMAVRSRSARLVDGSYPDEIQPLVDELNKLIVSREAQLMQARNRAGDLAHGLKTPLAVLEAAARNLDDQGQAAAAAAIRGELERMHVQVKRTLAQTRASLAAAQLGGSVEVRGSLARIVSAVQRLSRERAVVFGLDAPADVAVRMDESDFANVAGNLVDNAGKWAHGRVDIAVTVEGSPEHVRLAVSDDGPGLPEDAGQRFIERGKRLDESVAGSGFGLAIVKDIVEAYEGTLVLRRSPAGGLEAAVTLPMSPPAGT